MERLFTSFQICIPISILDVVSEVSGTTKKTKHIPCRAQTYWPRPASCMMDSLFKDWLKASRESQNILKYHLGDMLSTIVPQLSVECVVGHEKSGNFALHVSCCLKVGGIYDNNDLVHKCILLDSAIVHPELIKIHFMSGDSFDVFITTFVRTLCNN